MKLRNKSALITGSNRGIGFAILKKFATEGCNIIAHSRNEDAEFKAKCKEIASKNNISIDHIYFDLIDTEILKKEIKSIIKTKVSIDILINSAGIIHGGLFQMSPIKDIKNVFDVNFFGMLEVTQLVSKYMLRKKSGDIINIASIAGIDLSPGNCAYGTSKAAMIAFSKTLSKELSSYGIKVNVIAPSLTDTDMANTKEATKERELLAEGKNFMRMVKPEEIADLACFLCSNNASFINGQIIRVDGGNTF